MEETIYTKIIRGDIPCHKIYEDELTFAFLDIAPITPGHVLVVPKNPVQFLWDLNEADYLAVCTTAQKIAHRQREVLNVPYIGEQVIGVDVPHAHLHLIPFSTVEEYRHVPDASQEPDHESLVEMARKLKIDD